jgi:putative ABC transport system ATP-binding protein
MTAVMQYIRDEDAPSVAPPAVEFRDVVKRYGSGPTEVMALRGLSLSVAPGEFVAVMGPSGCGKSTLLHLAGALEAPSAGRVLAAGRDLDSMDPAEQAELRRRHLGYVFQRLNLITALTAIENVMLPLELDGMPTKVARAAARDALHVVGLAEQLDRYPDEFSGGQQQRIAIARAIVGDRRLLLADEPTGALDTLNSDQVVELLAGLCSGRGTALVMVTHEPRFASWADRVVFMRDGLIVDEAVPSSDTTRP